MVKRLIWTFWLGGCLCLAGCSGDENGKEDANGHFDASDGKGEDENPDGADNFRPEEDRSDTTESIEPIDQERPDGGDEDTDKEKPTEKGLGAPCTCEGTECEQMGVPKPANGKIIGCEEVPPGVAGTVLACLRSYNFALAPKTYFANGYCSLMATKCTGTAFVCGSAVFGDYEALTACPAGSVMLVDSVDVTVMGQKATVSSKGCVKACSSEADCRTDEIDPVFEDKTQYQCIDKAGVKFCYDPRNLTANCTATAF